MYYVPGVLLQDKILIIINVNYLLMIVNKLNNLILQKVIYLIFPQIHSPSSSR